MKQGSEIKLLLESLKKLGYGRRRIEEILGYAEFSLDQNTSRGGTEKIIASLRLLLKYAILEKRNNPGQSEAVKKHFQTIQASLNALSEMLLVESQTSDSPEELGDDEFVQGHDTAGIKKRGGKQGK